MTDVDYRADLDGAMLQLKESGVIHVLYSKWWKERRGGDKCEVRAVHVQSRSFIIVAKITRIMSHGTQSLEHVSARR